MLLCLLPSSRPQRIIGIFLIPHGLYAGIAGLLSRIPVLQVLPGNDLDIALRNSFLVRFLRHAYKIGVRGENSMRRLVSKHISPENIEIIPNVFEPCALIPGSFKKPAYDLIYVGGVESVKCIDILLESISCLRREYPEIRLALLGDGPLRGTLQTLVVKVDIEKNVNFLGRVNPELVNPHLRNGRIFIMTSREEGLPMAMIEALSCGLPVVMPDVGDVTTVARHGENALIVSEPTPEKFAEAVSKLLNDVELYARLRQGALDSRASFSVAYSLSEAEAAWKQALAI